MALHVSHESAAATEERLLSVARRAEVSHLDGGWRFEAADGLRDDAIAMVRDADGWCALVPAVDDADDVAAISLITFPVDVDNSGWVGWLASLLKQELGTGVFIVCGDNPERGGIYDYLGYPLAMANSVRATLGRLTR